MHAAIISFDISLIASPQGNYLQRRMKKPKNLYASFARMNVKLDWFITVDDQGAIEWLHETKTTTRTWTMNFMAELTKNEWIVWIHSVSVNEELVYLECNLLKIGIHTWKRRKWKSLFSCYVYDTRNMIFY